jgi:hypothetical protein
VVFELNQLIDNPAWQQAWLQYCRLEEAPADVVRKDAQTHEEGADAAYAGPGRLAAYAYGKTGDAAYAKAAVAALSGMDALERPQPENAAGQVKGRLHGSHRVEGPDALNPIDELPLTTNSVAQSALTAIEVLQLCADKLPIDIPPPEATVSPFGSNQSREGGSAGDIRSPGK